MVLSFKWVSQHAPTSVVDTERQVAGSGIINTTTIVLSPTQRMTYARSQRHDGLVMRSPVILTQPSRTRPYTTPCNNLE